MQMNLMKKQIIIIDIFPPNIYVIITKNIILINKFFQRLIKKSYGLFLYLKNKILDFFKHQNDSRNIYFGGFINKLAYFIQVIKDKNKISASSKDEAVCEKNDDSSEKINLTKKEMSSFYKDKIIGKNIITSYMFIKSTN